MLCFLTQAMSIFPSTPNMRQWMQWQRNPAGQSVAMSADSLAWEATLTLGPGANSLELLATETAPPAGKPAQTTRRHVNLTLAAAPARRFGDDDNGSLTATTVDGQPEFVCERDAANRLSAIVKNGARTEFTYDGLSRWVRIVEKGGTTGAAPVTGERRIGLVADAWRRLEEGHRGAATEQIASDVRGFVKHYPNTEAAKKAEAKAAVQE